jgi:UDP-N-acetylmuramoylalanine-D-glutamate ligase
MDEYRQARITPHVAILTHVSKSLASMGRKFFGILEFQTYNSFIVASDGSVDMLKSHGGFQPRAKILRTRQGTIPADWHVKTLDSHSRENASLAVEAASIFRVDPDIIHLVLAEFKPLKARLEKIKVGKNGVEFYNDSMSVRPESTLAALHALGSRGEVRSIVLIIGGSYTGVSYDDLILNIPQYVSHLILLPGSGTFAERTSIEKLREVGVKISPVKSVEEAVVLAKEIAGKGDRVLFSPAFDIIGSFESRRARGEEFAAAVRQAQHQSEEISLG